MRPRKLQPISFESALCASTPRKSRTLALNRMIAIANSRITSYFYGMQDAFDDLAEKCYLTPGQLAAKSFGEAAYDIGLMCGDGALHEALGPEMPSEDDLAHVDHAIGPIGQAALLSFVEPLARTCLSSRENSTPWLWKSVTYEPDPLKAVQPLSREDSRMLGDYLSDHFAARKSRCPETRLMRSFSFSAQDYYKAATHILGQKGIYDDMLEDHSECAGSLFALLNKLVNICQGLDDLLFFLEAEGSEPEEGPRSDETDSAYTALYLLFVKPYALIYKDRESENEQGIPWRGAPRRDPLARSCE